MKKIVISGTGCCLGDFMYKGQSFESETFQKFLSHKDGDGGLSPGKLVFTEEFESFCGCGYEEALKQLIGDRQPDTFNLGGPGVVPLINTSQLLHDLDVKINFFGAVGDDETASKILEILKKTPLDSSRFIQFPNSSPFTVVLSDPEYDHGRGDRIFINNLGCARKLEPEHLKEDFFDATMVVFGGTAIVPVIHDHLSSLLKKAKKKGCFTVVNTVYDFRHQKQDPIGRWPLGEDDTSYEHIDLLIMDKEEALRLSGEKVVDGAIEFFKKMNTKSCIITHGANPVKFYSSHNLFKEDGLFEMPVSQRVVAELEKNPSLKGDTTGCGDNFVGGVIASIVRQIYKQTKPSLKEAVALGVVSGGFCCYYLGGTFLENHEGEKAGFINGYLDHYWKQIGR